MLLHRGCHGFVLDVFGRHCRWWCCIRLSRRCPPLLACSAMACWPSRRRLVGGRRRRLKVRQRRWWLRQWVYTVQRVVRRRWLVQLVVHASSNWVHPASPSSRRSLDVDAHELSRRTTTGPLSGRYACHLVRACRPLARRPGVAWLVEGTSLGCSRCQCSRPSSRCSPPRRRPRTHTHLQAHRCDAHVPPAPRSSAPRGWPRAAAGDLTEEQRRPKPSTCAGRGKEVESESGCMECVYARTTGESEATTGGRRAEREMD